MSFNLQPAPVFEPADSFAVQQWMLSLQNMFSTVGAISWTVIDKTGSNLTDLVTRNHNDLQNVQGGAAADYYHLTLVQHTDLTDGGATTLHKHDHGGMDGLTDDDHTQYLLAAGTRALSADWDAGSFEIRAQTFESDVITGTAPLVVASTTKVTNLNADLLDDQTGSYYLDSANFTGTNWTDLTDGGGTTLHTHASGGISDFTEAAQDAAGAMAANSTRVTLTYVDATPSLTADLVANTITAGYLSASATDVLFGRSSALAGAGEEIACTAFARSILDDANEATFKATVNLEIGTDVQAFDTQLSSLAALSYTGNASKVVRVNALETDFELADVTATVITVANEATDTSCFLLFATAATGDLGPKSNANMTFNSNTGVVTFASSVLTTTDINAGTIDNTAIGGATPAAGAFTTVSASSQITSTVTTGTAPIVIASTTKVANLNVDLLDDQTGSYYLDSTNFTGANWTDLTDAGATTLHKHDHGGMDGLTDDDHGHYWNYARGAARMSLRV